ncbi:hypothetical protein BRADI_2g39706v3 [Brachypodium distachyon]|uniref:Uncharacterized protein n=1 Tax=Brachypodium distachyon TaxID=15368 RepID=A0A2K2DCX0_BRADI|nr:hypothetical protein BRADI_2g39706v3 [Brachypodium distachyon]
MDQPPPSGPSSQVAALIPRIFWPANYALEGFDWPDDVICQC